MQTSQVYTACWQSDPGMDCVLSSHVELTQDPMLPVLPNVELPGGLHAVGALPQQHVRQRDSRVDVTTCRSACYTHLGLLL
jgi:hypothetical protein